MTLNEFVNNSWQITANPLAAQFRSTRRYNLSDIFAFTEKILGRT